MKYIFLSSISFISLLAGSFFTVLVYRLPLLLQKQWQREYDFAVNIELPIFFYRNYSLIYPFSHCPNCHQCLTFFQKIPLLSFIWLKGKCAHCRCKISLRYPLLEFLALIISLCVFERFGLTNQMFAGLILSWGLLVLAFIDLEQGILPDLLVIPLLWIGLIFSVFHLFITSKEAILGASLAYCGLFLLAAGYKAVTKREGMGRGDFKCFALLGAWLGIKNLSIILFIAAFIGSLAGLSLCAIKKNRVKDSISFGPYLAIAGWLVLIKNYP